MRLFSVIEVAWRSKMPAQGVKKLCKLEYSVNYGCNKEVGGRSTQKADLVFS